MTEIHDWPGGHLQALSGGRYLIGPAFHWQPGDRVRLPNYGVVKVLGNYEKLPPNTSLAVAFAGDKKNRKVAKAKPGEEVDGIQLIDGYLTDGIALAEEEE